MSVWQDHQATLDSLFHREGDAYPVGSSEYEELKEFAARFMAFKSDRPGVSAPGSHGPDGPAEEPQPHWDNELGLPDRFDPRRRRDIPSHDRRMGRRGSLSEAQIAEYKGILAMFSTFLQKRSARQLEKLRAEQSRLPVNSFKDQITTAVRCHPVVVVAGDTGCGKSTQVPQILLAAGYSKIACTQPRRISAVSLSRRVAFETLNEYGQGVGYRIRFQSTATAATKIVFLTEGLLLRELLSDSMLAQYDVIIIDEVHERHVATDLLLAVLKSVIMSRPQMRLVLMSATINVHTYSHFFHNAPVIEVPGRTYPIQIEYLPPPDEDLKLPAGVREEDLGLAQTHKWKSRKRRRQRQEGPELGLCLQVLERIDREVPAHETGDLLVFLTGIQEIMAVAAHVEPYAASTGRWKVLLLHSTLSAEQQDQVFEAAPAGMRKCILSTNIAETSVTIAGVRFVVDSGKAKEMTHITEIGGASLQEQWISKASAAQRAGRAGRTGPGKCFRLYSEENFSRFEPFSVPELLRVPLESVVLQIKMLFPHTSLFAVPFLDAPPEPALATALANLLKHGALEEHGGYAAGREAGAGGGLGQGPGGPGLGSPRVWEERTELTQLGRTLALLPVDVPLGKMLILSALFPDVAAHVVTMAAGLGVQSPFLWLSDSEESEKMKVRRRELFSAEGDPFTLLNTFQAWRTQNTSEEARRRWCRRRGLQHQRLVEMSKLRAQFEDTLASTRFISDPSGVMRAPRGQKLDSMARLEQSVRRRGREGEGVGDRRGGRRGEGRGEGSGRGNRAVEGRDRGRHHHGSGSSSDEEEAGGGGGRSQHLHLAEEDLTAVQKQALKFIISHSLYPQFAVGDEHNGMRRESEQFYHTPQASDARLHPSSCLTGAATALTLRELVVYGSLLETTKLYLSSLTRAPALPALLLCAHSIDTNPSCSQLLFDSWLLVRLEEDDHTRLLLIAAAIKARDELSASLERKLAAAQAQLLHPDSAPPFEPPGAPPAHQGRSAPAAEGGPRAQQAHPGQGPPGAPPAYLGRIASLMETSVKWSVRRMDPAAVRARLAHGVSGAERARASVQGWVQKLCAVGGLRADGGGGGEGEGGGGVGLQSEEGGDGRGEGTAKGAGRVAGEKSFVQESSGGGAEISSSLQRAELAVDRLVLREGSAAEQRIYTLDEQEAGSEHGGNITTQAREEEGVTKEEVKEEERVTEEEGVTTEGSLSALQLLEEALAVREALQEAPQGQQPPTTRSRRAGVQVRPYLRVGSLPEADTSLAAHAIRGLLSHWACPACGTKVLGSIDDIVAHLSLCAEPQLKEARLLQREGARQIGGHGDSEQRRGPLGHVESTPGQVDSLTGQAKASPGQLREEQGTSDAAAEQSEQEEPQDGLSTEDCRAGVGSDGLDKMQEGAGTGTRRRYTCDACEGKTFLFTGTQILQHRAWHSKKVP